MGLPLTRAPDIDNELVIKFIQDNLGATFRDFDGFDTVLFSPEGWEYYTSLYQQNTKDNFFPT